MKEYQKSELGFTLIEVAMTILIGAVVMSAAGIALKSYTSLVKSVTTSNRIEAINDAIGQYRDANGKYPCPASYIDPPDTAAFGTQVLSCDDWAIIPAGTYKNVGPEADGIRVGAVPVRTLGLSEQYMEDGWGSRFTYVVSQALTQNYSASGGRVQVNDSSGNPIENTAHYAVISHGSNRIGGYTHQGKLGIPCPAGGPTLESNNCDHTPQKNAFAQTLHISARINTPGSYDDVVYIHSQNNPRNNTGFVFNTSIIIFNTDYNIVGGIGVCPPGWVALIPPSAPALQAPFKYCQKT